MFGWTNWLNKPALPGQVRRSRENSLINLRSVRNSAGSCRFIASAAGSFLQMAHLVVESHSSKQAKLAELMTAQAFREAEVAQPITVYCVRIVARMKLNGSQMMRQRERLGRDQPPPTTQLLAKFFDDTHVFGNCVKKFWFWCQHCTHVIVIYSFIVNKK